jgi:Asp-tRNA(Asn)/Glu-tRNA(Gln) amidotransferase C subunit
VTRLDRPALERLAALAALDLDEEQIPTLLEQIDRILEYASALGDPEGPDDAVERPWLPRILPPPRPDAARPPTAAPLDPRTFAPALRGGWFVLPKPGGMAEE